MKRWQLVSLLAVVVITLVWFFYALYFAWQSDYDYKNIQPNADFWGQIFASGFALVGNVIFFITLVQQTEELRLMRKEHQANREESRTVRELNAHQESYLRRQVLLTEKAARLQQFFQLRDMLREIDEQARQRHAQANHAGDTAEITQWHTARRDPIVALITNILDADHFEPDEVAVLIAIARDANA